MQLLTPLALAGGLLALPVILLYMLRLRRQEIEVSSIMLWQQLLQDTEANTPWQRLRRNLLLLLQLLILAALVFALARPFITVPALGSGQIVLLLDASASMNAGDVAAGTRFRAAQQEAQAVVSALAASDRLTLIRVAEQPQLLAAASNDRLALQTAINDAQPGRGSADWPAALTLALGGMAEASEFSLVIVSDGGLGDPALLPELPARVTWLPVGMSGENLAITALATRRRAAQPPQLFARVTNYGAQDAEVVLSLRVDGELVASAYHEVAAGADLPLVVDALPPGFREIEASLTVPVASDILDHLQQDDRAWALVDAGESSRVLLLTPENRFVEEVLRSIPGVQAFRGDLGAGLPREPYDLTILDRWQPAQLPPGDLSVHQPATRQHTLQPGRIAGERAAHPPCAWRRSHPFRRSRRCQCAALVAGECALGADADRGGRQSTAGGRRNRRAPGRHLHLRRSPQRPRAADRLAGTDGQSARLVRAAEPARRARKSCGRRCLAAAPAAQRGGPACAAAGRGAAGAVAGAAATALRRDAAAGHLHA